MSTQSNPSGAAVRFNVWTMAYSGPRSDRWIVSASEDSQERAEMMRTHFKQRGFRAKVLPSTETDPNAAQDAYDAERANRK